MKEGGNVGNMKSTAFAQRDPNHRILYFNKVSKNGGGGTLFTWNSDLKKCIVYNKILVKKVKSCCINLVFSRDI